MTGGVAGFPYSSTQARGVPSDQYHVSPSRSEGSTMLSILGSETSPLDDEDRKPAARRKTKITIDRNESDLDSLFALAPEIVEVDSSTYGIFIFILPFVINNPNHLKVVIAKNGRSAGDQGDGYINRGLSAVTKPDWISDHSAAVVPDNADTPEQAA